MKTLAHTVLFLVLILGIGFCTTQAAIERAENQTALEEAARKNLFLLVDASRSDRVQRRYQQEAILDIMENQHLISVTGRLGRSAEYTPLVTMTFFGRLVTAIRTHPNELQLELEKFPKALSETNAKDLKRLGCISRVSPPPNGATEFVICD